MDKTKNLDPHKKWKNGPFSPFWWQKSIVIAINLFEFNLFCLTFCFLIQMSLFGILICLMFERQSKNLDFDI